MAEIHAQPFLGSCMVCRRHFTGCGIGCGVGGLGSPFLWGLLQTKEVMGCCPRPPPNCGLSAPLKKQAHQSTDRCQMLPVSEHIRQLNDCQHPGIAMWEGFLTNFCIGKINKDNYTPITPTGCQLANHYATDITVRHIGVLLRLSRV